MPKKSLGKIKYSQMLKFICIAIIIFYVFKKMSFENLTILKDFLIKMLIRGID